MTAPAPAQRVLVKLSGESFCGESPSGSSDAAAGGFDAARLSAVVDELEPVLRQGTQLAVVVGAGNFVRGRTLKQIPALQPTTADAMGMVATVLNGLALRDALLARGLDAHVLSAFAVGHFVEPFSPGRAKKLLQAGSAVIFVGGTGCPFFTTDTCAALRAAEIEADLLVKATKVDGVFDSDPETNPAAQKFDRLTADEAIQRELGVMDLTAFTLCRDHHIPVVVLELFKAGSLAAAVRGESAGTVVSVES